MFGNDFATVSDTLKNPTPFIGTFKRHFLKSRLLFLY